MTRLDPAGRPFGVGSRLRNEQPRLPPAVWEVTSYDPPTSFTLVTTRGGVRTEAIHVLTPRPDGGVTVELGIDQTGPMAWLASLLYGRLTRRYVTMEAEGVKGACEAA